jgi:hypothetical protein
LTALALANERIVTRHVLLLQEIGGVASDQWIDLALARLFVEVDAIGIEHVAFLFRFVAGFGIGVLVGAAHRARFGPSADWARQVPSASSAPQLVVAEARTKSKAGDGRRRGARGVPHLRENKMRW